jgi:hypothetical protein
MIAKITGGLAAGGVIAGGVCSWITLAALLTWYEGIGAAGSLFSLPGASLFLMGGALGAVATPVLFWTVLRHVPFGTVLKLGIPFTVAGAMIGEWWRPFGFDGPRPPGVLIGAFAGFVLAGLVARLVASRRAPAAAEH